MQVNAFAMNARPLSGLCPAVTALRFMISKPFTRSLYPQNDKTFNQALAVRCSAHGNGIVSCASSKQHSDSLCKSRDACCLNFSEGKL